MTQPRTLTQLDEWPRHQTIDTFDTVATSDAGWSDGYWFCFGDPAGRMNFITAIRLYHNTNVMDAYAIASTADGKQYNLRASRRLRPRIDDLSVGPFWMEIVEGLKTIRLGARDNEHGVEFDVLWEGASPPHDEASGVNTHIDGRLVRQRANFIQAGDLSGWVKVGGERLDFRVEDGWAGVRDHSWGLAETGTGEKPNPYAAPVIRKAGSEVGWRAPGMRHWAVVLFRDRTLFYAFRHNNDGSYVGLGTGGQDAAPLYSRVDYRYDDPRETWSYREARVEEAEWVDGFPRMKRGRVAFTRVDGGVDRYDIQPVSRPVYMQGGGYWGGWKDGLGRGVYRGEEYVEGDVWDVSHPVIVRDADGKEVPQRSGNSFAELYARYTNVDDPSDVGLGLLEAVINGEYEGIKAYPS